MEIIHYTSPHRGDKGQGTDGRKEIVHILKRRVTVYDGRLHCTRHGCINFMEKGTIVYYLSNQPSRTWRMYCSKECLIKREGEKYHIITSVGDDETSPERKDSMHVFSCFIVEVDPNTGLVTKLLVDRTTIVAGDTDQARAKMVQVPANAKIVAENDNAQIKVKSAL